MTCAPQGGSLFPLGTTTVTCVAMDRAGNSAQAGFTVSVAQTPLLAPPVLHLPRPIRAEATSRAGARVVYTASATDALFPRRSVPIVCTPPSGATFRLGLTIVACSASDARGARATGSFTIAVVDTTAPRLRNVDKHIEARARSSAGAVVRYRRPLADDRVDGAVPVTCTPVPGTRFAIGSTRRSPASARTSAKPVAGAAGFRRPIGRTTQIRPSTR